MTWTFLAACLVVTALAYLHPPLGEAVSGIGASHPWQRFTAVFMHGWPGFPAAAHLALNAVLLVAAGRPCERLLGSSRFLLLSCAAAAANAVAQGGGHGVNGSSLVIWSWGPPLWAAVLGGGRSEAARGIRGLLLVMYGLVTLAMTALPYLGGWRGSPLTAFLLGNRFHLVATAVGAAFTIVWWRRIRERAAVAGLAT